VFTSGTTNNLDEGLQSVRHCGLHSFVCSSFIDSDVSCIQQALYAAAIMKRSLIEVQFRYARNGPCEVVTIMLGQMTSGCLKAEVEPSPKTWCILHGSVVTIQ
jgi:hypothetical protein